MTGVVTPGPGQATASPSNVAVPGPRTNSSRPKALRLPAGVPDGEEHRVAARLRVRVVDELAARRRAIAEVPGPVDELAALRGVGEGQVGARADRVLGGLAVGEREAGGRGGEARAPEWAPGGGVGPGTTGSEAPPHAFLRREIALRRRLIAGRPLRSGRSLRASLVERRAVVFDARQPQRRPVAAGRGADDHAREVAGIAGEHEVGALAAVDDRGAASAPLDAAAALEAHVQPSLERRAQRHAHERAGGGGDRLDLADLAVTRDRAARRGGGEEREERARRARARRPCMPGATFLDPVRRRQAVDPPGEADPQREIAVQGAAASLHDVRPRTAVRSYRTSPIRGG